MGFRHIGEVADETKIYLEKRRKGLIKSCKTGFKKLDRVLLGGIEYGSVITIGGRPSVGKTAYSSAIIRGILQNNDNSDLEILDFNWEMSGRSLVIRDLSAEIRDSYGNIISADEENKVSDEKMEKISQVLDNFHKYPWYLEEDPKSTKEFEDIISRRVKEDPKKKRIVRIDHTILAKQSANEASQVAMLQNLLAVCVKLKKQSDIIFIILTQMVREFEDRQLDGTNDSFPRRSDVYGGDAASQSSDILILLNRPASYGISYYGKRPNGKMVTENDLFAHVVKSRNSSPDNILSYNAKFSEMRMIEL